MEMETQYLNWSMNINNIIYNADVAQPGKSAILIRTHTL